MFDLGRVNPLLSSQLKLQRENLILNVLGNWDDLSEVRKSQLGEIRNSFL